VLDYLGNYTEFHDWREARLKAGSLNFNEKKTVEPKKQVGSNSGLSKNQQLQLEKRIAEIEKLIPDLESQISDLNAQMSQPEIAADFTRLNELTDKLKQTEEEVQQLYSEWESAADQLG
jgi:ATP-binding cassette subfamily F protein 3